MQVLEQAQVLKDGEHDSDALRCLNQLREHLRGLMVNGVSEALNDGHVVEELLELFRLLHAHAQLALVAIVLVRLPSLKRVVSLAESR